MSLAAQAKKKLPQLVISDRTLQINASQSSPQRALQEDRSHFDITPKRRAAENGFAKKFLYDAPDFVVMS